MKGKGKWYADKKRNAQESNLAPGDQVLVNQKRKNKLSTPFAPEPYDVVTKTGNSIVVESTDGVQLMRTQPMLKSTKRHHRIQRKQLHCLMLLIS